ncbi:hypothetical protein D3C80_1630550 [compost metagenome]
MIDTLPPLARFAPAIPAIQIGIWVAINDADNSVSRLRISEHLAVFGVRLAVHVVAQIGGRFLHFLNGRIRCRIDGLLGSIDGWSYLGL